MKRLLLALPLLLLCASAHAQVNALSCSQIDVQNAINTATAGQTVNIPAGSCSWSAMTIAKAVTLTGAGQGVTVINLVGGTSSIVFTKQTGGVIRVQNLTLAITNIKVAPHPVTVSGPWPTGQPIIFYNIAINLSTADFMSSYSPGGVIFSHINFHGLWGDTLFTGKNPSSNESWLAAGTLGMADSTGLANTYIEDSVFNGGNITDCDDGCRAVLRHNTLNNSGGFNSHGADSSPYGMRHFEIYSNHFLLPDKTCPGGSATSPSNINQWIWIRGGTGVIFNNDFDFLDTDGCWGVKPEWKFSNRGIEDDHQPQSLTCLTLTYPAFHQIGQNYNGSAFFTDPITIWGNIANQAPTSTHPFHIQASTTFNWGNPCAFNWNTYWQWGRDGVNSALTLPITLPSNGGSVEGIGGTPKVGYTPYTYPHPLAAGTAIPIINFSPNPVPFGTVNVGSPSAPVTTTITNVGSATETYTNLAVTSQWARSGGTCTVPSGTLAASASCTYISIFTPTSQGPQTGTLTMTGTVTSAVQLTGSGQTTISIPSTPTGLGTSVSGQAVSLHWTASTGTLTGYKISRGTVSGGPYTLIATTITTAVTYNDIGLANGTYYYVVAAYNTAGTSANSTQASAVVATAPSANLVPASINFGNVVVGSNSNVQTSTLTNLGTATLSTIVVNDPSLPDFSQTNNCGATLAINASCTISMVFSPTTANTEQATLTVTSNDSPQSITLNGVGQPPVVISPPSLTLTSTYTTKTSAVGVLTYSNPNGPTITVSSVTFSGGDASVFSETDNCVGSVVNGGSCTINITFTPTSNGTKTTNLVIIDNASGSPRTIVVTGQAKGHHILKVGVAI
jgi:hypothetical protein